jgi:hypothetical protein|tara:strand:+ start:1650 stop:1895 length:246 start_codon:yes stop_codon:yes gene_type:complete
MIGQLVTLSASGKKLKCCQHLKGRIGLVVDIDRGLPAYAQDTDKYWIDWIGLSVDEAYPARKWGYGLANGMWGRRDFKKVK